MVTNQRLGWTAFVLVYIAIAILAVSFSGATLATTFSIALAMATLGVSFQLVYGLLGELSLGQPALFGTGCYTFSLLAVAGVPLPLAVLAAAGASTVLGAAVAAATSRLGGAYFAVATLSLSGLCAVIVIGTPQLGGDFGIIGVPGLPGIMPERWQSQLTYAFLLLAIALVVFIIVRASRLGRSLEAVRASQDLARSLGISVPIMRILITALSGTLAGLAGAFYAQNLRSIGPDVFGLHFIITPLAIVAIGGARALWGTIPGALIVVVLPRYFKFDPTLNHVFSALVLLIIFILFPAGLLPQIGKWIGRLRSRRTAAEVELTEEEGRVLAAIAAETAEEPPPATPGDVVLHASDVNVRFGAFHACAGMGIDLRQGEVVGLIGANGAGKSTFVNALTGHVTAQIGELTLAGRDISRLTATQRARAGLARTFQQPVLMDELTVRASLKVARSRGRVLGWFGPSDRAAVEHSLELVGLTALADARVSTLTFLDRRLLGIALALTTRPVVLMLDEATAGLTSAERHAIGRVILTIARSADGPGVIVIEHDVAFVADTCDRIMVMHDGKLIKEGLADDVLVDEAVVASYLGSA